MICFRYFVVDIFMFYRISPWFVVGLFSFIRSGCENTHLLWGEGAFLFHWIWGVNHAASQNVCSVANST